MGEATRLLKKNGWLQHYGKAYEIYKDKGIKWGRVLTAIALQISGSNDEVLVERPKDDDSSYEALLSRSFSNGRISEDDILIVNIP
jgi:hypothetical protein